MSDLASFRTHTDAVVAGLRAIGPAVFDAGPPALDEVGGGDNWGWQGKPGSSKFKPYLIVYPMEGGTFDGPLGCPDDDASLSWQVTCVGADRRQCEWLADQATAALVGQRLVVPGRYVSRMTLDMAGGARRDDTVQPPVFIATPRYRAASAPTGGG